MSEEVLDRFARGELSSAESQALAQQALDDPELFDELTAVGVGRTGLSTPRPPARFAWRRMAMASSVAAAAAVLLLVWSPALRRPTQPGALSAEPILLARSQTSSTAVFRGADSDADARPPRALGSVVAVEDGLASIDLGSVDGLAKGGAVEVVRNGQTIGTIALTTMFRQRARGTPAPGLTVRAGDQVRVPEAAYLGALLDQIDAFSARGDAAGARQIADQAARLTAGPAATGYADLNNLAVIAELRGDRPRAESLYRQALGANPPDQPRRSIGANLARLKGVK